MNTPVNNLTADEVRAALDYDPATGAFTRRGGFHAKRWGGKPAGVVHKGHGYVVIKLGTRGYLAHRLAWLHVHGVWPSLKLDHKNGVRSDNRIENLREVTDQQNTWNRKRHVTNEAGVKGVSYKEHLRNKWCATIRVDGKQRHIGVFPTKEAAHEAYKRAAERHFGEYARSE